MENESVRILKLLQISTQILADCNINLGTIFVYLSEVTSVSSAIFVLDVWFLMRKENFLDPNWSYEEVTDLTEQFKETNEVKRFLKKSLILFPYKYSFTMYPIKYY